MADQNGITVKQGKSLARINAVIKGCKDRGIQFDAGHCGVEFLGGKISECDNDGGGGETGNVIFCGTKFENNGKKNNDSGDALQVTNPSGYEIQYCQMVNHPNAALIFCQLKTPGIIRKNRFFQARHGLALELCGFWPFGDLDLILGNLFKDLETGLYLYGQKPIEIDMDQIIDRLLENNTFENCGENVRTEWTTGTENQQQG